MAWMGRYSFLAICFSKNSKYLLKELWVVSVYAVACFGTNRIVLWPVALCLVALPVSLVLVEVLAHRFKEEEANGNVENVIDEPIQI